MSMQMNEWIKNETNGMARHSQHLKLKDKLYKQKTLWKS